MKVFETVADWRRWRKELGEKKIGFVPTMGFLHEGHLSLVEAAKVECDLVVVSIFVNPAQFDQEDDFEKYPRDYDRDLKLLEERGVDVCFLPRVEEIYPDGEAKIVMKMEALTNCLCGKYREGHFEGVLLVVAKLLNIVGPDCLYLGQKDYQQCLVIKQLVKDLNFEVAVKVRPTVREESGLAMSSRNQRLSEAGLKQAAVIKQVLDRVAGIGKGEVAALEELMESMFRAAEIEVEYAEVRRAGDLARIEMVELPVVVAVAVWIEGVRLIDNVVIN